MSRPLAAPNLSGRPFGNPHDVYFQDKIRAADTRGTTYRLFRYLGARRSALMLVFLFALSTTAVTVVGTRLNGYTVDRFIRTGDRRGLAVICLVLAAMYVFGAASTWGQNRIMVRVAQRTSSDIRRDLFAAIQALPLRYFDARPSGDLMSRLTNDVDNVNLMLSQGVVQLFAGAVMILGMLLAMLASSPLLTAVGLAVTPILFFGPRLLARWTRASFAAQQEELGALNSFLEERISGHKTIALFTHERESLEEFRAVNARYVKASSWAQGLSGAMGPVSNITNNLTFLILSVTGAFLVMRGTGGVTLGVVFSFLLYMRNFTRPINEILNLYNVVLSAIVGAERVFEVMDAEPERDRADARDLPAIAGDVWIHGVDFSYVPGKPVLRGAEIRAERGRTVAIVGPTGAGKTTIISLLTRFYDVDGGQIFIDGADLRTFRARSLRQQVSIVLQDPFLFTASVRENLRYGRLSATDQEIEEAARRARAHEFILQLPRGYDTRLSDNGGGLSQGQRQLLSIARAMLAESAILVLDEATSSVDTRTELLIQEALRELARGRTCFVIAHRLSTIRKADQIVVIDGGRVAESGTHDSLLARSGLYAELYRSQFDSAPPPTDSHPGRREIVNAAQASPELT